MLLRGNPGESRRWGCLLGSRVRGNDSGKHDTRSRHSRERGNPENNVRATVLQVAPGRSS
ncbi:hypothetical protein PCLA_14r0091 [Pseudomonas citronellolis]|nr:hypothetical protein PCLA_14r0091 [Pseudomonas citronellolis]